MNSHHAVEYKWLRTGETALEEMLLAIASAKQSVRLEMYIFHLGPTADQFREALVNACKRGLRVWVLLDGLGSAMLPETFWQTLRESGGEFRWFNPLSLPRLSIRDHRKVMVCDEAIAFIGGFNIANEYRGDGIVSGWRDLGMKIRGPLALELAAAFDQMFACADFKHKPFTRLRKSGRTKTISVTGAKLLLGGPGRRNPLKQSLRQDLKKAQEVLVATPYFVPPWKLRRVLMRLARRGAKVQLILPGKCDIPAMRLAAQSFYRRLLAAGVEICEYQPQILHAKLFVIDNVAYAGSSNLDGRSLNINYELMVRLSDPAPVEEARKIFAEILSHCRRIDLETWKKSRTFLDRMKARLARFIIAQLDYFFAGWQLRSWNTSLRKVKSYRKRKASSRKP